AARARWIACDAGITRIVLGPDGVPLDLGREHRLVSSHLRRAVEARDRGCVFTGCSAPTHWCDVHHLLEWINGGATSLENSALLRERHHTKVHHGFRLARQPDGRWRTWRPDGTEIRTGPDLLHAA
ncbi:HNH endonuclease signature motif containing protein, partial [Geodermatophilus ruber]